MGTLQLPADFQFSYENSVSYPQNLVYRASYLGALQAYTSRLDTAVPKLLVEKDTDADVPFRDFRPTGQGAPFKKQNILSDAALKEWLGDQSTTDPNSPGSVATKVDPKCRFIFLWAAHSRASLKITRRMLVRILSYHQVMPGYLDFISVFGAQNLPRDLRFSGFREQTLLSNSARRQSVPALGRSGRQFQLCYNLKTVSCLSPSTPTKNKEWSIRQAAFHHQFDVDEGTTLWIVTKGNLEIKKRIQDMTGKDGRPEDKSFGTPAECFKSSLAVHLLNSHWSTEDWRWYVQWLEDVVDNETHIAVWGPRGMGEHRREYRPDDLQAVQDYEDKTNEVVMVLEANMDVLISLRKFYENLLKNKNFDLKEACEEDILQFATQVNNMIYDSRMQIARAKLLVQIIDDRKNLILQHLQSQATESMEDLTRKMHNIGIMAQKEAVAMRIITVVTLIFLPATFVSTFFSTDVVKYQNQNSRTGSFSKIAMVRWLEVALPLTVVTLSVGYIWFIRADKNRKHEISCEERLPRYESESKPSIT
ncbi:uncharacterized protein K441DRAFT_644795 [Cenococcum geophilum 1.58]|uniref:uncharacterized protein n=1 Tax=Cenococcum geophilum 1.58 TaxID=794803 RepID=UPI00358E23EE|nr:hypothetical protein K441DRAFT_644795 [Cenococcum geophilum 1.58]